MIRTLTGVLVGAVLTACSLSPSVPPPRPKPVPVVPSPEQLAVPAYEQVRWSQLPGWASDEVKEAWPAFLKSCRSLRFRADWTQACTAADAVDASSSKAVRAYFDRYFEPYAVVKQTGTLREESGADHRLLRAAAEGRTHPLGAVQCAAVLTAARPADDRPGLVVSGAEGQTAAGSGRGATRSSLTTTGPRSRPARSCGGARSSGSITRSMLSCSRCRVGAEFSSTPAKRSGCSTRTRMVTPINRLAAISSTRGSCLWTSRRLPAIRQWLVPPILRGGTRCSMPIPVMVFFNEEKIDDPSPGRRVQRGAADGWAVDRGRSVFRAAGSAGVSGYDLPGYRSAAATTGRGAGHGRCNSRCRARRLLLGVWLCRRRAGGTHATVHCACGCSGPRARSCRRA